MSYSRSRRADVTRRYEPHNDVATAIILCAFLHGGVGQSSQRCAIIEIMIAAIRWMRLVSLLAQLILALSLLAAIAAAFWLAYAAVTQLAIPF